MTGDGALAAIEKLHDASAPALVAYVNAHSLNLAQRDDAYRAVLAGARLVLNDGSGVALAARMQGRRFPQNLNGSDFNPQILALAARRRWPVFLLGGRPGVAPEAAARLQRRIAGLQVAGTHHGYFAEAETPALIAAIRASSARVLMVAMGNPRQELWLHRHLAETGAGLGIGVGAFLDFVAGTVARAPGWMNKAGIEWLYRLALEPRRMWRRYVVGNPLFLARVVRERLSRITCGRYGR